VAQGDDYLFRWIIGWWAQIFQQPSVKMGTGLALRGKQGVGKTIIGKVFGRLLGEHYMVISSSRFITSHFNSHLASLLVLHADEAFWAGDKQGEGVLKDMATGDTFPLERKGVDPINIKSFLRLFACGNQDWLVPAGFRERRWAVIDMGEDHMQDKPYFAAIITEMENGGYEALLQYLLDFDLSTVDLRTIPKTAALRDQQIASMTTEESWWFDTLKVGKLPNTRELLKEENVCSCDGLQNWYIDHAKRRGFAARSSQISLGIFLKKHLGGALLSYRPRLEGGERARCYRLPSLKACRERFAEQLGQPFDWDEDGENETWRYDIWNEGRTYPLLVVQSAKKHRTRTKR
jgi:hypothetical protein